MRLDGLFCSKAKFFVCSSLVTVLFFFLLTSAGWAQTPEQEKAGALVSSELNKYPGLLEEFGRLVERIQREVKLPEPREHSELLPRLPESTIEQPPCASS